MPILAVCPSCCTSRGFLEKQVAQDERRKVLRRFEQLELESLGEL